MMEVYTADAVHSGFSKEVFKCTNLSLRHFVPMFLGIFSTLEGMKNMSDYDYRNYSAY